MDPVPANLTASPPHQGAMLGAANATSRGQLQSPLRGPELHVDMHACMRMDGGLNMLDFASLKSSVGTCGRKQLQELRLQP
eukprot:4022254-Amphidinium_carterae.1